MEPKKANKSEELKPSNKQDFPLLDFNHIRRFSLVITTTLVIVLTLIGLGYYLDTLLDTKPWLLLIGLIASFPIAQIAVYKKMKQYTQKEFDRLNIKRKK